MTVAELKRELNDIDDSCRVMLENRQCDLFLDELDMTKIVTAYRGIVGRADITFIKFCDHEVEEYREYEEKVLLLG